MSDTTSGDVSAGVAPDVSANGPEVTAPRRARSADAMLLLLITLVGGFLRFSDLSAPAVWRDEAAVYWRVCGSFAQMLDILRNDGFMPLHYELYFLISRCIALSPAVMRFVPALCGTLTIPVIYFLACELFAPRAALLAAAMAAGSAFLFHYSRDAKMYADFYLMSTLSPACLLWWLRTRTRTAWLAWTAASLAMIGLHALGLIVLGLQPLVLLSHRRGLSWRAAAGMAGGFILIGGAVAGHALGFNQFRQHIDAHGWRASGLSWIAYEIRGQGGEKLLENGLVQLMFTGSNGRQSFDTRLISAAQRGARWTLLALIAAGTFPWRGRRAIAAPQPSWRAALWLAMWVCVPVYGFYCVSIDEFAWPSESIASLIEPWAWPWVAVAAAGGLMTLWIQSPGRRARLKKTSLALAVVAAIVLLCFATAATISRLPREPLWMARYFGFVLPPLLIAAAALLSRLPLIIAWSAVGVLIFTNAPSYPGVWPLPHEQTAVEQFARDVAADQNPADAVRTYSMPGWSEGFDALAHFDPIDCRYYLFWASARPTFPQQMRDGDVASLFTLRNEMPLPQIIAEVQFETTIDRVNIWLDVPARRSAAFKPDTLPKALPGFMLAETTTFHMHAVDDFLMENIAVVRQVWVRDAPH